ncbi:fluoride efflux transporter FluC [Allostreptomyces psammosilenae]|uniref:fluoride efflux transporter FluC n=1 Tax=Allostreptomyces psammosilenae TaxID=1892865 RepID=UPI0015C947B0|nr:CrcB family protein [Allostreptomyces psammosilenae]
MDWALVVAGGMVGAVLRYLTDRAVQTRMARGPLAAHGFPYGILLVNVAGSALLGLLAGAATAGAASHEGYLLLGTGLCGALTTYSTFSWETLRLAERGHALLAGVNVAVSLAAGILAAFAGAGLSTALFG